MVSLTALASELHSDPAGIGYAAFIATGQDSGVEAAVNSLTGPGAALIGLPTMARDDMVAALLPYLGAIAGLSGALAAKWNLIWSSLTTSGQVELSNGNVQATLGEAVTDGIMTAQQAGAIGKRVGSRAEVLFGAGTVVTHLQIAAALGRGNGG